MALILIGILIVFIIFQQPTEIAPGSNKEDEEVIANMDEEVIANVKKKHNDLMFHVPHFPQHLGYVDRARKERARIRDWEETSGPKRPADVEADLAKQRKAKKKEKLRKLRGEKFRSEFPTMWDVESPEYAN